VLVASTDPAPSLGDAYDVTLAAAPRRIPLAGGRLSAVEINAAASLKRWLDERRTTLESIAVEGTWLDRDDVARLLRLSLPGIDELAALLEIARLAASRRYDLIIVDTAPTGHTLRMLAMPRTLFGVAVAFDRMREKHRVMEEALRGAWRPAVEDALVNEMADTARSLAGLLRDPRRSRVSWVTLPEPMAVAETADAVRALSEGEIDVAALIVNRLTPPPPSRCGHCDARRSFEAAALAELRSAPDVLHVQTLDTEPRGIRALRTIAGDLSRPAAPAVANRQRRWRSRLDGTRLDPADLLDPSLRLVLAGGKGGVGKTTAAAALGLAAARRWPDRRVLLISTDPAHSLADVFGVEMSNEARPVPGAPANLHVRELDAAVVFTRIRDRYVAAIDKVFDRLSRGSAFDAAHDRSVMQGLIDLAPPGLDELAAVLEITDALTGAEPEWDLVVMDTAPTGHALRLLEMPGLMQDWTRALMRILLKYQGLARVGDLGELLLKLSRGLGTLRELLVDPTRTAFVVVTRPAILPRLETDRLLRRLTRLRIHVVAVVINAVGRGACARCLRAARAQQREILATRRSAAPKSVVRVVRTETRIPAPRGPSALQDWARTGWRSGNGKR
jgi:arsenite-transporting ATPase